jgi:iron complex outermembrane receptor protein
VVSGSWIEMPGGTSSVAYGAQWRSEGYKVNRSDDYIRRPDPVTGNVGVDLIFLGGGNEVDTSRDAIAVFAEANLPMSESIELSVAGRYEALDTDNSLDSKISLRWQMADNLVFRASGSTAFREPSLVQLNNQGTSLQGLVDPNSGSSSALFVQVISEGNPTLKPEQSTNTNLGLVWSPSDNLDMRVDYWKFNYKDVITVENAQGKLDADPNGDFVSRVDGVLNGVGVSFINAAKVNTDGIDVAVDWNIPAGGAGDFGLRLAATQFFKYEIPTANGTKDVVGLFNHDNFVRSMPKTKWNLTADWENGNHRLAAVIYDTSSYRTEREVAPAAQAMGFSNSIASWTTIDLQYSYNFMMGDTEGVITLGGKNITDEEAPRVFDAANFSYDPKQHDPRGQMWYGRVKFAL